MSSLYRARVKLTLASTTRVSSSQSKSEDAFAFSMSDFSSPCSGMAGGGLGIQGFTSMACSAAPACSGAPAPWPASACSAAPAAFSGISRYAARDHLLLPCFSMVFEIQPAAELDTEDDDKDVEDGNGDDDEDDGDDGDHDDVEDDEGDDGYDVGAKLLQR